MPTPVIEVHNLHKKFKLDGEEVNAKDVVFDWLAAIGASDGDGGAHAAVGLCSAQISAEEWSPRWQRNHWPAVFGRARRHH